MDLNSTLFQARIRIGPKHPDPDPQPECCRDMEAAAPQWTVYTNKIFLNRSVVVVLSLSHISWYHISQSINIRLILKHFLNAHYPYWRKFKVFGLKSLGWVLRTAVVNPKCRSAYLMRTNRLFQPVVLYCRRTWRRRRCSRPMLHRPSTRTPTRISTSGM